MSRKGPAFPAVFSSNAETNRFLRNVKTDLENRLTLADREVLFEAVDLAVYFAAIRRKNEAVIAASFFSEAVPFSNAIAQLWPAIGSAIALEAHLRRQSGDSDKARAIAQKIVLHPARPSGSRDEVERATRLLPKQLEEAFADRSSQTGACKRLARVVEDVLVWRETAEESPWGSWLDIGALDELVKKGFECVQDRIEGG